MTTPTPTPLVLARLNNASPIVDPTGLPSPLFVQTINNAFANITTAFAALAQREADLSALLAQIVALNGLLTTTQTQVTAILANQQSGSLHTVVSVGASVSGRVG